MKRWPLFFLRLTVGWLLVLWGLDKFLDVEHGLRVAQTFYGGLGAQAAMQRVLGGLEILLGLLVMAGLWRAAAYPATCAVLAVTALGVWRSIVDPWGWFLDGAQVLFYPSAIILAAAFALWGFKDEDRLALDALRRPPGGPRE